MIKKKYCFDLDGTITSQEILPLLAAELDLYDEISALTKATINGLIPFEQSFKLRCKLLSEIPLEKVQEISNNVKLNNKIVEFIKENNDHCYVITGNIFEWIKPIVEKLGCDVYCSKANFVNGRFINLQKILNKGDVIKKMKKKKKFYYFCR